MAYPLEIILHRQLAECQAIPVFIVDPTGNLLFYNEAAEELLGRRFEDTGEMPVQLWSTAFQNKRLDGATMPPEELPLVKTLHDQRPHHGSFRIESMSGINLAISVTALPITNRSGVFIGAVAIFWKMPSA